jgi:GTP-binding protein HflX
MIETEKDNRKLVERAVLVAVQEPHIPPEVVREHLYELNELVNTMGVPVIGDITVSLKMPQPKFYIGSGKAEEINQKLKELEADCLIFDCELAPSQQRNWEKLTKICVIDRQEVILDIFAARASTREASLQVELARMQYSLPRLTRAWTHLSRQQGGAKGTRGEGEKQIEVDRRLVQKRISKLKKELKEVEKKRITQRKKRAVSTVHHAAIVGYTNAGKSTLMRALSGADVLVEDKLFATLDPTTRRVKMPSGREILLTDTVGFVRKLPHSLVEAFKSTLEEAVLADFIILVLDVSSRYLEDHRKVTIEVLQELGAEDKEVITVYNKADLLDDPVLKARLEASTPGALFVSAGTGAGIDLLRKRIDEKISMSSVTTHLLVPPDRFDIISKLHRLGTVLSLKYNDTGEAQIVASVEPKDLKQFEKFSVQK